MDRCRWRLNIEPLIVPSSGTTETGAAPHDTTDLMALPNRRIFMPYALIQPDFPLM